MHRTIVILFIAGTFIVSCGSSKKSTKNKPTGTWQAQPIAIDGDSKDWPSPYPNSDSKAQIAYATANDKDNLYISVETGDPMTELKILRAGMTVWIDTGGGKGQNMAVNYPLPAEATNDQAANYSDRQEGAQSMDREKRLQERARRAVDNATQLSLDGFAGCNGAYMAKQTNNCGISVRMAVDEYNELVWEAAIPFKVLYGKEHLSKKDEGRPVSVCFEIKGVKWQGHNTNGDGQGMAGRGSGGMRGGGGGGMHGGGMHGGGGMRGGGGGGRMGNQQGAEHSNMTETTKTWKQFGLAYKE